MKPRANWLTQFADWFLNTSPEWVAPHEGESAPAEPPDTHQPPAEPEDGATRDPPAPDQQH